jgi:hypothetical protein
MRYRIRNFLFLYFRELTDEEGVFSEMMRASFVLLIVPRQSLDL